MSECADRNRRETIECRRRKTVSSARSRQKDNHERKGSIPAVDPEKKPDVHMEAQRPKVRENLNGKGTGAKRCSHPRRRKKGAGGE